MSVLLGWPWSSVIQGAQLAAVVALAAYLQSLTGFAFGLVLLALSTQLGLLGIADASQLVNSLTLAGALLLLGRGRPAPNWRLFAWGVLPALPMVPFGLWLLGQLSGDAIYWLGKLLGLVVVLSSLTILWPPPLATLAGKRGVKLACGVLSGLMGGMFATAGPPLVLLFYQLGLPAARVRDTLMLVFACCGLLRLLVSVPGGVFNPDLLLPTLLLLPVYWGASRLGLHRMAASKGPGLRRLVALLLLGSGLAMLA